MDKKDAILPLEYKYLAVFLTMRCNLKCSYCLNTFDENFNRKRFNEISGERWVNALNRIKSRPELPITLCGGEPFLHKDFIYLLNNLKPDLNIDILTNLSWCERGIEKFINEVNPERIKRDSPYASIRASYHPEQMGDGEELVKNAKKMQDAGFSVGIWTVQYPNQKTLEAITRMQFRCRDNGIDFRIKDFMGKFEGVDDKGRDFSIIYGDYSRYKGSVWQDKTKNCLCRTSELIIGPDGNAYKCHRDLYLEEYPMGNVLDKDFKVEHSFKRCGKYGQCHPCDVKLKTDSKQKLGYSSVEIKDIS